MRSPVEVTLPEGRIRGVRHADGVAVFRGIPFAAPPVGALRWRDPHPVPSWRGIRSAETFAPHCCQNVRDDAGFVEKMALGIGHSLVKTRIILGLLRLLPTPRQSEDCLYLNVRTSGLGEKKLRPVLVWFHGGSYQTGSGADPLVQTDALVRRGIVVVTANYRLGMLGYFAHPALSAESEHGVSGNYGLLDQIAALRWVRERIAVFGGDPQRVTVAGQSAGGSSILVFMVSPLARGLFHRAIVQSGEGMHHFAGLRKSSAGHPGAEAMGSAIAEKLGLGNRPDAAALRALPVERITSWERDVSFAERVEILRPHADGWVFPRNLGESFRDLAQGIPLLIGCNADEGSLLQPFNHSPTVWEAEAPSGGAPLAAFLERFFDEDTPRLLELYGLGGERPDPRGAAAMWGDDLFGMTARFAADRNSRCGAPTYLYCFTRSSPMPRQTAGAFHYAEVPFVFDSHNRFFVADKRDGALTLRIGDLWARFISSGDPNGPSLPSWPRYRRDTDQWLNLGHIPRAETVSRAEKLDILERALLRRIGEEI